MVGTGGRPQGLPPRPTSIRFAFAFLAVKSFFALIRGIRV
jgi:hypothetical protein